MERSEKRTEFRLNLTHVWWATDPCPAACLKEEIHDCKLAANFPSVFGRPWADLDGSGVKMTTVSCWIRHCAPFSDSTNIAQTRSVSSDASKVHFCVKNELRELDERLDIVSDVNFVEESQQQ